VPTSKEKEIKNRIVREDGSPSEISIRGREESREGESQGKK